jgi:predicted porin
LAQWVQLLDFPEKASTAGKTKAFVITLPILSVRGEDFMNKKLVAVAVAAVLAAPLAAQAQTANVTLYGRVNLGLTYIDANGSNPSTQRLDENSSRFGIRGTESLGGGLNAIFQIESSTPVDAGGGTLAGRDSFLGLQGSWGTVKWGRMTMPYDDLTGIFGTITLNTSILAMSSIWANNGGNAKNQGSFDARLSNVFRYDSPNIAGFTGAAAISLDSEDGRTDPFVLSLQGTYRNGPFVGAVAYEANKDVRTPISPTGVVGPGLDDWAFTATIGWNFGVVNVIGLYERLDYDTPTGSLKRDFWGITAIAPIGPGNLQVFWMHGEDGKGGGSRVGGLASGDDTSADHYQISYVYPLSKRTAIQVGYSGLENDSRASYNYGGNAYLVGTQGLKLHGFMIGAWHNF